MRSCWRDSLGSRGWTAEAALWLQKLSDCWPLNNVTAFDAMRLSMNSGKHVWAAMPPTVARGGPPAGWRTVCHAAVGWPLPLLDWH